MNNQAEVVAGSFRDPAGFLYHQDGVLYRQINHSYRSHYEHLMQSGLYEALVNEGLMVAHEEVKDHAADGNAYTTIRPTELPVISYPFEWSFSQLQDAALLTLRIQQLAVEHGMSLKDASAYNVQFIGGQPIFIDTLSFELYDESKPWVGYKQYCQHFLAPLALMAYTDVRLNSLLQIHIDGIPLDLAASALPWKTKLRFGLLTHIHVHAKAQQRVHGKAHKQGSGVQSNKQAMLGFINNLASTTRALKWQPAGTEWGDYYADTNYNDDSFAKKKALLEEMLKSIKPRGVLDVGGNTGLFSRIASELNIPTVSSDIDPAAVEKNYRQCRETNDTQLTPLVLDLTNPSPGMGWHLAERSNFFERMSADTIMALALIHHLAINNNVPLERIASFFAAHCEHLIIEFVPKGDSQVDRLLSTREDIFPNYTAEGFEKAFGQCFEIVKAEPIAGSKRTLYHLTRK